jgi:hypothetical protein
VASGGIENYTLDIAVDDCMACGEPLRYSVVVTNGEKTSETDPPGQKTEYAPTVEDLFRMIEASGPIGSTVTYNDAGVPTEMHSMRRTSRTIKLSIRSRSPRRRRSVGAERSTTGQPLCVRLPCCGVLD